MIGDNKNIYRNYTIITDIPPPFFKNNFNNNVVIEVTFSAEF